MPIHSAALLLPCSISLQAGRRRLRPDNDALACLLLISFVVCISVAGLPEEAFLEELSVLAPQHARELLRILEGAGLLRVTTLPPSSTGLGSGNASSGGGGGGPTSVLAACFAAAPATGSGHGGAGQAQEGGAVAGAGPASEQGDDDASDSEAAGGQQRPARQPAQRFYFVLPGACFSASRVLPPQVLLPQAAAAAGAGIE